MGFPITFAAMGAMPPAHHSATSYKDSTVVRKNATVTALIWANPPAILTFVGRLAEVIFADGRTLMDSQNRSAVTQ